MWASIYLVSAGVSSQELIPDHGILHVLNIRKFEKLRYMFCVKQKTRSITVIKLLAWSSNYMF